MPEGPQYFPDDMITNCSEEFLIEEIVREKVMQRTRMEVPYSIAVVVEGTHEGHGGVWVIDALVIVEKPSQKKILIVRERSHVEKARETSARRN